MLRPDVEQILRELNPWWRPPHQVRPVPPTYRRRRVDRILGAVDRQRSLIQVLRGPRQVGKTTALYQVVEGLLARGRKPSDILLVRFDLDPLRELGLRTIVQWHREEVRKARDAGRTVLLLDEVHKLERWDEEVKHVYDTWPCGMVLTGSSSVLVARGQRESLAGRAQTEEFPPFLFREVLEAWSPQRLEELPAPIEFARFFEQGFRAPDHFAQIRRQPPQRLLSWRRRLDRYYNRGGYPRLHSGEVDDDRWADYLVETVFDRVLGVDIPDLFPVDQPRLLRHVYLECARRTGSEVSQGKLAGDCNVAGFRTSQPVVGKYLHYLADALLIREFRRYPLDRSRSARVPLKITLTDLGVRNAIFRGAPSLFESPPEVVGPLVETLVQGVLSGVGLQVHFFRDFESPRNRKSPVREVDFVVEALDGSVLPLEVKFRSRIDAGDTLGVRHFLGRFPQAPFGILVTRDLHRWDERERVLCIPLLEFLLAF
jgi:predicted AAA+ superfamily ATPase